MEVFLKILIIVIAAFVGLNIIAALVLCIVCFTRCLKDPDMKDGMPGYLDKLGEHRDYVEGMIKRAIELETKPVEIRSYDGLTLYADLYEPGNADTTIVLMHGWQSSGIHDFGCIIPYFYDKGYNVLLTGQRGQWKSGGKRITMGTKEKYDAVSWCNYVAERYGKEHNIILEGLSMGAATVMYASALELPENVRGIIADCGYTSPYEIIKAVAKQIHVYPYPIIWFVEAWFRILCGNSMRKDDARVTITKNTRPILFIHGEADDFVPCYMSKEVYERCTSEKEIILVPRAGHGQSYLYDMERCERALDEFIARNTGKLV